MSDMRATLVRAPLAGVAMAVVRMMLLFVALAVLFVGELHTQACAAHEYGAGIGERRLD